MVRLTLALAVTLATLSPAAAQQRSGMNAGLAAVFEEEMTLLKETIESNFKVMNDLKARIEALEAAGKKQQADLQRLSAMEKENEALRARLVAVEEARAADAARVEAEAAKAAEDLAARRLLGGMFAVDASVRVDFESIANQRDLDGDFDDQETFLAHRIRAGLRFHPIPTASLYVQVQDVRRWGREEDTMADDEGLGLHQGYVRFDDLLTDGLSFQAGRFEMAYGSGRLIGTSDFAIASRSFDAVRLAYHREGVIALDAFVAKVAERATPLDRDRDLYGLWMTTDALDGFTFDLYTLLSNDNAADSEETVGTVGARMAMDLEVGLFGELEAAVQFGQRRAVDVLAVMYAAELGYRLRTGPVPFDLSMMFTTASGDGNPADDRDVDFDSLFPNQYTHYGKLEQVSLRNLMAFGPRVGVTFLDDFSLEAELYSLWLVTPFGTRFGLGDGRPETDETTHFGEELDLTATWTPWDWASLQVGYSFLIPDQSAAKLRGDDRIDWVWITLEATY
ncbi:MAG: hypothetical protein AMXMBFR64_11120 [Myxococcales bacterium]